jgi:hypothetical protein
MRLLQPKDQAQLQLKNQNPAAAPARSHPLLSRLPAAQTLNRLADRRAASLNPWRLLPHPSPITPGRVVFPPCRACFGNQFRLKAV